MHCNKWLVTQPPFSLMGLEREVFHICRLLNIFHFSISVDIRAAFIQLAGLALMLSPGPGNKPMQLPTNQTDSWLPLLKTLVVDSPGPASLGPPQASSRLSPWARPSRTGLALSWLLLSWSHGDPGHGAVCHRRSHHPFHGSSQAVWHLGAHVLIWR